MDIINLTPRLSTAVSFISQDARVADIGTDHGYIPVWLAQTNTASHIVATDINEQPLQRARISADRYSVSDKISFILCNGLIGIPAGSVDTIVIAGMGGETIAAIIEAAPWCCDCNLILQPMSRREKLSQFLSERRLNIANEKLVFENGEIYPVLYVKGESGTALSADELYVSKHPFLNRDPLLPAYLEQLTSRLCRARDGALRSSRSDDQVRAGHLTNVIDVLQHRRKEFSL